MYLLQIEIYMVLLLIEIFACVKHCFVQSIQLPPPHIILDAIFGVLLTSATPAPVVSF